MTMASKLFAKDFYLAPTKYKTDKFFVQIGHSTQTDPKTNGAVYQLVNWEFGLVEGESFFLSGMIGLLGQYTAELEEAEAWLAAGAPPPIQQPPTGGVPH